MKSIRSRILVNMILTVAVSLVLIGVASISLNYNSTKDLLAQSMTEAAHITADRIAMELKVYTTAAIETGSLASLSDPSTPLAEKQSIIDQKAAAHGFERGNIIMPDGISILDGIDYSEREYFQESMAGRTCVSEPILSKRTNELAMIISAPLWKDGISGSEVVGVVYYAPHDAFLNDIVTSIKISPNSSAYIVDKEGYTIAHQDIARVEQRENIEELAKTKPELAALAVINANMRAGKNAFESYQFNGVGKFNAYAPIAGSDGWSISLTAPTADFMDATIKGAIATIFMLIVAIIAAVFVAFKLANYIGKPMKACADRLELLAQGDLKSAIPQIKQKDETGTLATATGHIVDSLNDIINDESYLLSEMAAGNFNLQTEIEEKYIGDFQAILMSIRKINTSLSQTLWQIDIASDQVSSGSDQVSSGAQSLAQGATEQASSVQELSASISGVSEQIKKNASHAANVNEVTIAVGENINISNAQMGEMIAAMTEISQSSQKIGNIIKTIEDIAFQTNILALNAAVEAARAGEAGKGFAVVADEVRNLANKSGMAAKQTSELIEGSIKSVEQGVGIADRTAKSLADVVVGATQILTLITEISEASIAQSTVMAEINQGVEQISAVVQTNSAISEESAAASEELNGQAQELKKLVGQFKLKENPSNMQ